MLNYCTFILNSIANFKPCRPNSQTMKHTLRNLFVIILLTTSSSIAQNRSIQFNQGSLAEILDQASKQNKMVFVDCYTSWCGPCKWMAKNIFTNDTVADFYNQNFINAKIDMEKGEGIEIAKIYGIRAYPTLIYLNSTGEQMHRVCGAAESQEFIGIGKDALMPEKQLASYTKKFNAEKVSPQFALEYFEMIKEACQSNTAEVDKYFAEVEPNDFTGATNWKIIFNYLSNYSSKAFQDFEKARATFTNLYGADSVDMKISSIYENGLYASIREKDKKGLETVKAKIRAADIKDAEKIILEADVYQAEKEGEWPTYASLAMEFVGTYVGEDAQELNKYAWTFYEHVEDPTMLKHAESWAKTAIELDGNYANIDTYAAVLYKLGNKNLAEEMALKAINVAQEHGEDASETEALLVKIRAIPEQ